MSFIQNMIFKGCAANKTDDAARHLLYIIRYLLPSSDIKLQQQYEDPFQVSPWLNFSVCSFNAHVISSGNQHLCGLLTFTFTEMRLSLQLDSRVIPRDAVRW